MLFRAEGEDPFLGPALLLVAPAAAERRVEAIFVEGLSQSLCLHHVGMDGRAVRERIDARGDALRVDVDQQLQTELRRHLIAERDHLAEFPGRIDVHQRKRRFRRIERLHGEMQHHGAVLADGVEHHRTLTLRDNFAHDVDALGLQAL